MSAALMWWKFEDAASPLTNSGTLGAGWDVPYDAVVGDGEAAYHVPGLFGDCIEMSGAGTKCDYWVRKDAADQPYFGTNVSMWIWITPVDLGIGTEEMMIGRTEFFDDHTADFLLKLMPGAVVRASVAWTDYSADITTAAGVFTWGSPHLFALTDDGVRTRVYVDGVEQAGRNNANPIYCHGLGGWQIGNRSASMRNAQGKYHDAGYDNTTFSAATLMAMYHSGVP